VIEIGLYYINMVRVKYRYMLIEGVGHGLIEGMDMDRHTLE